MKVAVIGAGKMGLPLACRLAQRGAQVTACDIRQDVVEAINKGRCPISEPGVAQALAALVKKGKLRATQDTATAVSTSETIITIVPALLTAERQVDLTYLKEATKAIARGLRRKAMVCYETTLPVGGTAGNLKPLLEESGLKAGVDFDLVFSPERVKSQSVLANLAKTPKIVGSLTPVGARRAARFYSKYLGAPVINLGTLEAAELSKLAGMVYRDVNIALANELSRYAEAEGVDLQAVIAAANTDGESALLTPGIGVGGHCTPVYPYFLTHAAREKSVPVTLAERARGINDEQCGKALDRVEQEWSPLKGKRALILGLGFRPQVKEHSYSTAFLLREALKARGADVLLDDPLYTPEEIAAHGFTAGSFKSGPAPHLIVLNTGHAPYAKLDFSALSKRGVQAILDGRNFWKQDKARRSGLAYFGIGRPSLADGRGKPKTLPIARPVLGSLEIEAAGRVLSSDWIMQGPQVSAFEREFARMTGAKYACAVSSGTAALHLALLAAGVKPGDEVITASHSFIATANAIRYCGAIPVFADIEPATFNIDPSRIETLLSPRTRAILCVHQMGMPCDLAALEALAKKRGLALIEDAACAAGSEIFWQGNWEPIGRPRGAAACFSFHPRKVMTTGDGGMITTDDPALDAKVRSARQHGMAAPESYESLGYNYRLTDIQAAIGREQLKRLPAMVARRRELAARYAKLLAPIKGVQTPQEPSWARSNWQSYCVRFAETIDAKRVLRELAARGVSAKTGIMCAHLEPAYTKEPCRFDDLAQSEKALRHCVILPLYPQMSERDQERVARALKEACATAHG